jgi:HD-like signal output (HDOD) protein
MNDHMRELVGPLETLPRPLFYYELRRVSADPSAGIAELVRVFDADPALGTKLLQLTNSALFGVAKRVISLGEAAAALGAEQLKALVLAAHAFSMFEGSAVAEFSLDRFEAYSTCVARLARRFAPPGPLAEQAFAAGMVHDLGEPLLATRCPERFAHVRKHMLDQGEPIQAIERRLLGVSHAEVGARLLELWDVSREIVEAVAHHQEPARAPAGSHDVLAAVHAAYALLGLELHAPRELDLDFLRRTGHAELLPEWRALVQLEITRAGAPVAIG